MFRPPKTMASETIRPALLAVTVLLATAGCDLPGRTVAGAATIRTVEVSALRTAPPGAVTWCTGRDTVGAFQTLVDSYNATEAAAGHRLELREFPGATDLWHDRLADRLRSRSAECDLIGADVTWVAELAANRWVYDLGPYLDTRRDGYLPTTLTGGHYSGRDWAVPFVADVGLLYYRTDQVAVRPQSWQQVYAEAARTGGIVYQGSPGEGLTTNFLEIAYASGGRILSDDGRRVLVDSRENLAALRLLTNGIRDGAAPRAVQTYTQDPARRAFEAGRATFHRDWASAWASVRGAPAIGANVDAIALPAFDGGGRGGVLGGTSLLLPAYSDNPTGGLRALDWLTSERGQRLAAGRGLTPTLAALYDEPLVREALPHHQALRRGIEQASVPPVTPAYRQLSEVVSVNVSNALTGRASPREALAEAEQQLNQVLRRT
jgi:multiple sugar transport system substrate-binding protein